MIEVGSLCSGYGGIEIGLKMALPPAEVVWVAETDPAVSRVLKRQHEAPNLGDITASPWRDANRIQVLCAGFPCQPVSAAGRQGVTDDHRWLWPDVRRAIHELQPGAVFIENVRNLIAVKYSKTGRRGEVFADILRDLQLLGYQVRWLVLGACVIGAPHHRHRVFLVAGRVPAGQPVPPAERVAVLECGAPRGGGRFLLPTPVARDGDADGRSGQGGGSPEYWARKAAEGRTNGIPLGATVTALLPTPTAVRYGNNQGGGAGRVGPVRHSLDQVTALLPTPRVSATRTSHRAATAEHSRSAPSLEQAVEIATGQLPREFESWQQLPGSWQLLPTPQSIDGQGGPRSVVAESRTHRGTDHGANLKDIAALLPTPQAHDGRQGSPTLHPETAADRCAAGRRNLEDAAALLLPAADRWGKYAEAVALWEILTGNVAPEPAERGPKGSLRLAPELPEWMMGLPRGFLTDELPRLDALRAAGNGVLPAQAAIAWHLLTT